MLGKTLSTILEGLLLVYHECLTMFGACRMSSRGYLVVVDDSRVVKDEVACRPSMDASFGVGTATILS